MQQLSICIDLLAGVTIRTPASLASSQSFLYVKKLVLGALMATYTPKASDNESPVLIDDADVLNLRPLLDTILKWWREIFLLTVVAAVLGGARVMYSHSQEVPLYEASAQV